MSIFFPCQQNHIIECTFNALIKIEGTMKYCFDLNYFSKTTLFWDNLLAVGKQTFNQYYESGSKWRESDKIIIRWAHGLLKW